MLSCCLPVGKLNFNFNITMIMYKNNALWALKRLPLVIVCGKRLYSTSLSDAPITGAKNDTRINEIIQLISKTKTFEVALTHKSYHSINPTAKTYETLEFLGDSILEFYITLFLFNSYPELSEGKLTDKRTQLVEGTYLSSISLKIGLHKYLKVGQSKKGVDFTNKSLNKKDSKILADIFESFIAALYIEKGKSLVNEFLMLTILNKPEFIKLLAGLPRKLNNEVPEVEVPKLEVEVSTPATTISTESLESDKFSKYMDKSLNNQKEIVELLVKMYVLMEYNSKKGVKESNHGQ